MLKDHPERTKFTKGKVITVTTQLADELIEGGYAVSTEEQTIEDAIMDAIDERDEKRREEESTMTLIHKNEGSEEDEVDDKQGTDPE